VREGNVWQYGEKYEIRKRELDTPRKYEEKTGTAKPMEQTWYLSVSSKKNL